MTLFLILLSGACRCCFPGRKQKAFCFVGVVGAKAGVRGYWGWDRRVPCTKPWLCYVLLCVGVCVVNNLGMVCNGILGPKEYPLGDICFWPNPSFWNHTELLMLPPLPLRELTQKLRGTPGSLLLPSFAKHNTPLRLSRSCPLLVGSWSRPTFQNKSSHSLCNMASWVPGESEGELVLGTSWCPGGLRELSLLPPCSGLWLAGQPCRCSWLNGRMPQVLQLLGILVGLTLKATILGIAFFFFF